MKARILVRPLLVAAVLLGVGIAVLMLVGPKEPASRIDIHTVEFPWTSFDEVDFVPVKEWARTAMGTSIVEAVKRQDLPVESTGVGGAVRISMGGNVLIASDVIVADLKERRVLGVFRHTPAPGEPNEWEWCPAGPVTLKVTYHAAVDD